MNIHSLAASDLLKEKGGIFELKISGDCMSPVIKSGDTVRVVAAKRYFPGDVVIFRENPGRLVAHRLLGSVLGGNGWRYMTKPDRDDQIDGLLVSTQVLGRVSQNISQQSLFSPGIYMRTVCILSLIKNTFSLARRKLST